MNPITNRLEPLTESPEGRLLRPDGTPVPSHWAVFTAGELIEVKGHRFRVAYCGETTILLEPVRPALVGTGDPLAALTTLQQKLAQSSAPRK